MSSHQDPAPTLQTTTVGVSRGCHKANRFHTYFGTSGMLHPRTRLPRSESPENVVNRTDSTQVGTSRVLTLLHQTTTIGVSQVVEAHRFHSGRNLKSDTLLHQTTTIGVSRKRPHDIARSRSQPSWSPVIKDHSKKYAPVSQDQQ